MPNVNGGRTLYGHALGILMLETTFPRLPGDVGNALTWPFPVRYRLVDRAVASRIMGDDPDPDLLGPFVDAALELESEGVGAITTSCGFLAAFQRELAAAVSIPMLTSSLLQVPLVARLIGPGRRVGILTERPHLNARHFRGVGWSEDEVGVQVGTLPVDAVFPTVYIDGVTDEVDTELIEREVVGAAARLAHDARDLGALVLECTNFVPFSQAIRRATGLPVFDLYTLVMQTYLATVGYDFGPPSRSAATTR